MVEELKRALEEAGFSIREHVTLDNPDENKGLVHQLHISIPLPERDIDLPVSTVSKESQYVLKSLDVAARLTRIIHAFNERNKGTFGTIFNGPV